MRLKSYFAESVDQAISRASKELGPEAMLVYSREAHPEARYLGSYEVVFRGCPGKTAKETTPRRRRPRTSERENKFRSRCRPKGGGGSLGGQAIGRTGGAAPANGTDDGRVRARLRPQPAGPSHAGLMAALDPLLTPGSRRKLSRRWLTGSARKRMPNGPARKRRPDGHTGVAE